MCSSNSYGYGNNGESLSLQKLKKNVELFLKLKLIFSKLIEDTETIPPQEKLQGCRLSFRPTKFQSFRHQV